METLNEMIETGEFKLLKHHPSFKTMDKRKAKRLIARYKKQGIITFLDNRPKTKQPINQ